MNEQVKEIQDRLLTWMDHSIRGQRKGNPVYFQGKIALITDMLDFINSLPEQPVEETPEPYTGVYDEAYLKEKIARATKSWEGVDLDKMLAECRGYEQPVEGLEEAAISYYFGGYLPENVDFRKDALSRKEVQFFIAGAKWQAEQTRDEHFWNGIQYAKKQMMEEAVEGEVEENYLDEEGVHTCVLLGRHFNPGDEVYVIKKENGTDL